MSDELNFVRLFVVINVVFLKLSSVGHSDDGFRSGCRNVSQHQQQSFSGLHYKPGRSPNHNSRSKCYKEDSSLTLVVASLSLSLGQS